MSMHSWKSSSQFPECGMNLCRVVDATLIVASLGVSQFPECGMNLCRIRIIEGATPADIRVSIP